MQSDWKTDLQLPLVLTMFDFGQAVNLQDRVSSTLPIQSFPPYAGFGESHIRVNTCDPSPQVTEHVPLDVQLPNPPSTGQGLVLHFLYMPSLRPLPPFAFNKIHSLPPLREEALSTFCN